MRKPVYDVYQMKPDRLPAGTKTAWLRTRLGEQPTDDWTFVGRERYPSRWTVAEVEEKGSCYREIPEWLYSDP